MNKALEEAANWYARLHAPDCRLDERREFELWLEQNPDNARIYAAAERMAHDLSAHAASDARLSAMAEQAMAGSEQLARSGRVGKSPASWLHPAPVAIAASLFLCAVLLLLVPDFLDSSAPMLVLDAPKGEQRAVTLEDGTLTKLDVDSAMTVEMSAKARDVTLLKGRAIFDVAHDKQRPFSVRVGDGQVKALGTKFQVQSLNQTIVVTLEEGSVEVANEVNGRLLKRRLRPGEQLRFTQGVNGWIKSTVEADVITSWSKGRHVFRRTPLVEAVAEINRYSGRKVRLGDPTIEDLKVSGNFIIGDGRSIVSAFSEAFSLRVVEAGNELVLFPQYRHGSYQQSDYVR